MELFFSGVTLTPVGVILTPKKVILFRWGVNITPKLELQYGSYWNSTWELNLTPSGVKFNSFVELNCSLIPQGELNELFWSQFLGVSVTLHCHSQRRVKTLLQELFFWGCLNSAKGADVTPYLNSFVLEVE